MKYLTAAVLCLLCWGCAAQRSHNAYDGVSDAFPGASETLAQDAADRLTMAFAPGRTVLRVDTENKFGGALEAALRRKGFSFAPHGLNVGYNVDLVRDETSPMCYVRLNLPNGNISQLYTLYNDRAVPAGGVARSGLADFDLPDRNAAVAQAPLFETQSASVPEPEDRAPEITPAPTTKVQPAKVRANATAKEIARRNGVNASDFCRWNNVEPWTLLSAGQAVYLKDPGFTPEAALLAPGSAPASAATPERPSLAVAPAPPAPASVDAALLDAKSVAATPERPIAESLATAAMITPLEPPASGPAPFAPPPALALPTWDISPGLLRPQLESWTAQAGYQLIWKAGHDFEMHSRAMFQDDFLGAVKRLFAGLHQHGNPLRATIYQDNRVLEIVED